MVDRTYVPSVTSVDADWLNSQNGFFNTIFNGAVSKSDALDAIDGLRTLVNVGGGLGTIARDQTPVGTFNLKTLSAGTNTQITNGSNEITISSDSVAPFDTVTSMVASTDLTVGDIIHTAGYLAKGDGGDNTYEVVTAGTGTVDGGEYIDLATHQARGLFPGGIHKLKQWGVTADGVTDDTTEFQSALDFGGELFMPSGSILVSVPLDVTLSNTALIGEGVQTQVRTTVAAGDIFTVTGTAPVVDALAGVKFHNFLVFASLEKTSGYAFNCTFARNIEFRDVGIGNYYMTNRLYDGIFFDRFDNCLVDNCFIGVVNDGIRMAGNTDQSFGSELTITGKTRMVQFDNKLGKAIHIAGSCGGVYLDEVSISGFLNGVVCDDTLSTASNRELFFGPHCIVDGCAGIGINFLTNCAAIIQMTGTWASSCLEGINVKPVQNAALKLTVNGARIYNNENDGIAINDGTVSLIGCFIHDNGSTTPFGHGVNIANTAADGVQVTGNFIYGNGRSGTGYGINIATGITSMLISDNQIQANAQGPILNATTLTTSETIRGNGGFVTENSGTATVLNTATTVVVSHGLTSAPTQIDFSSLSSNQGTFPYVETITSTQFTLNLNATASANRDFYWSAKVGPR